MRKILGVLIAVLAVCGCDKNDINLSEGENNLPEEQLIDSSLEFEGKTYSTWIKDSSCCISIKDSETQKEISNISTKIEGGLSQIANLPFGDKQNYTIKGCFILDIKNNGDDIYLLLECSEYKYGLGVTEIIKLSNNKVVKRVKHINGVGRPNRLTNWYNGEMIASADLTQSIYASYDTYIYGRELNLIHKGIYGSNDTEILLDLFPIDTHYGIQINANTVILYNFPAIKTIWEYQHSTKEVRLKKKEIKLNGNIATFNIILVHKDGVEEAKTFKLNIDNGSLVQ